MRRGVIMRERRKCLLAALVLLMAQGSIAQTQQPKPGKAYVLKAARMYNGKSGALSTPGLVIVTNGKISGVGPQATTPAGATTIDLGDATLLPGFIDAHTHLSVEFNPNYNNAMLSSLQRTPTE